MFFCKPWSVLVGSAIDFWTRSGSVPADLQEMHRNNAFPIDSHGFLEARGSFWTTFRSLAGHNFFISAIQFRISGVSSSHWCLICNRFLDTFRLSSGGFAVMHRNQAVPIPFDGFVEERGSFWTF